MSDEALAAQHELEIASKSTSEGKCSGSEPVDCVKEDAQCDPGGYSTVTLPSDEITFDKNDARQHDVKENPANSDMSSAQAVRKDSVEEEADDVELGGFFLEDAPSNEMLSSDILEMQKQEQIIKLCEKNLEKLDGIWKMVSL